MRLLCTVPVFAAVLLAGCGTSEDEAGNAAAVTGDNTVSISAPGFNMSVDLPADVARNIDITTDGDALYPGAKASGIKLTKDQYTGQNKVDIGFTSSDSLDKVAKWYGNPRNSGAFKVTGINISDSGVQTMSVVDESGEFFNVILREGENGGTSGTLKFSN
jgi:hypothetical protein